MARRGDTASLSLIEAYAAAEEAFGSGSPEVDALNVVFATISQAAAARAATSRPAVMLPTATGLGTTPARTREEPSG
jgi:hypothetical protein